MPVHTLVKRYVDERDSLEKLARDLLDEAALDERDLSGEETARLRDAKERIDALDEMIAATSEDFSQRMEVQEKVSRLGSLSDAQEFMYRDAGHAVYDALRVATGDQEATHRYRSAMKTAERSGFSTRAAEHMGTDAAKTTATAGDLGGLVIVPKVGAIINPVKSGMPFASSLGLQRIPSAAFARPYIDDPSFATGAGVQTLQKAEVPSKAFTVKSTQLDPVTVAGYLNISQQLLEMTPGALGIVINQLRLRVAYQIETALFTEVAKTTTFEDLAAAADAGATIKAIYNAAAKVLTATQEPASWIVMGPLGFARLGALVDAAGRPLFPYLGPANAEGTAGATGFTSTVAGLTPIVSWAITDDTYYVGNGMGIEAWYYPLPVLEAVEPSVLGRQVAVGGMFAPYRPTPVANSIVKVFDHA